MLAASVLALEANIGLSDVQGLIENREVHKGATRKGRGPSLGRTWDAKVVLVIDDSIATGGSLARVREAITSSGYPGAVFYAAVYCTEPARGMVDLPLEVTAVPRIFQWNLFHRWEAERYCVDIDGVLCMDPTVDQNDDGPRYESFLLNAVPLARPSYPIGHLVTSRLERYREHTESWLRDNGVQFNHLHMLDLPSAAERRRLGVHSSFKAAIYSSLLETNLFIESESAQAAEIAQIAGKPVLDYGRQSLVRPGVGIGLVREQGRSLKRKLTQRIRRLVSSTG